LEVVHVDLVGGFECASDACVVQRIIYPAKFLDSLLDAIVNGRFVCDIEFDFLDGDVGIVLL
jgi:hypothetical protein